MEELDDALLEGRLEVDEEVAAGHEVQAREGRSPQEVVRREEAEVADVLRDRVRVAALHEEARQPLGAHLPLDDVRVSSAAGLGEGGGVDVGREDLDLRRARHSLRLLAKQHRDRVGLLAGGAARDPRSHVARGVRCRMSGIDDPLEHLERRAVTEEARDVDHQVVLEPVDLALVASEQRDVLAERSRCSSRPSAGARGGGRCSACTG